MRVVVVGSSGLIGTALRHSFQRDGHSVVSLVRRPPRSPGEVRWDPTGRPDPALLDGADAVVNLAGANIGDRRWDATYRRVILESRTATARALAGMAAVAATPPGVLLCASGIRYYGTDRGEEILTEATPGTGDGFLSRVAHAWERATEPARDAGIPVCHLRFGIVLSRSGGALGRMLPFFRAGLGAHFASGRQFWSHISLRDTVAAIRFLAASPDARGPYNITAPEPARNIEFTRALAWLLGRPAVLRVPGWALRVALGGASEDAVTSLRVLPDRLVRAGFRHEHPDVRSALRSALATG